jgi:hypothetical protein
VSYVDENGIEHVSASDHISAWGNAHVACCPMCASRYGATVQGKTFPLASSGADAEALLDAGAEVVVVVRSRWKGADVAPR